MGYGDAYIYAIVLSDEKANKAFPHTEKLHYLLANREEILHILYKPGGKTDVPENLQKQLSSRVDEYGVLIDEQLHLLDEIIRNPLFVQLVCDDSRHGDYALLEKEHLELQPVRNFCEAHGEHAWISPELEAFDKNCLILVPCHADNDEEFWADLYGKDEERRNDPEKAYRYGCPACHMGALLGQKVEPFTCPNCGKAKVERQGEVDYSESGKLVLYVTLPNGKQMLQNEL